MSDRKLLEDAARAAGLAEQFPHYSESINDYDSPHRYGPALHGEPQASSWNPLTDDGDALRLAVRLRLDISHFGAGDCSVGTTTDDDPFGRELADVRSDDTGSDPYAATRRAIVRAAAAMAPTPTEDAR